MITKCCITWVCWLVECRLTRTCFRGTSWITKSNFWNPDLPYYLRLVWSSQINWPIGLNATEQQILVGFMRAKMKDEDLLFLNASLARGPSGPSFSICNQPIFISDRVPFFVCPVVGEGAVDLFANWGEEREKWMTSKFHVWTTQTAGNSVGPERAPKKAKRSVNECVLVSGSPFFLLAIAEDSKWPGLYSLLSLFTRGSSDFIGEDLTDCLKANEFGWSSQT